MLSAVLDHRRVLACITQKRLRLILMSTERCNFRCTYCYEDFRFARMQPWVVRGVKALIARRASELEELRLSWFGGEPLLALDLVEEIQGHAQAHARSHPEVRLGADMTTNAYLLKQSTFRRLLDLGVSEYQITFDGPKECHDHRRLRADGSGTFDEIWNRLLDMSGVEGDFDVTVRLHVDAENYPDIPRFLDQYKDAFGEDSRFHLFIRRIGRLGGPNDDRLPVLGDAAGLPILESIRAHAEERGLRSELEGDHHGICYAAHANSFVVRSDGRLNKCTVALNHPLNQVGRLSESGDLELDGAKGPLWRRGLTSHDLAELECPMQGIDGDHDLREVVV